MKYLLKIGLAFLLIASVANVSAAAKKIPQTFSKTNITKSNEKILTTKGKVSKVDPIAGMIYLKQDGRTIRFQADGAICYPLSRKINKKVEIKYVKTAEGVLIARDYKIKK